MRFCSKCRSYVRMYFISSAYSLPGRCARKPAYLASLLETKGRGIPSGNKPTLPLSFLDGRQVRWKVLSCEMSVLMTRQKKVRAVFGLLHFRIGFTCRE